jgi:hypothetical protein
MTRRTLSIAVVAAGLLAGPGGAPAGAQGHADHAPAGAATGEPKPVRITMEALHAAGGVPPGWRFTPGAGDPAAGRQVFVTLNCHTCHAIRGEQFPLRPGESATAGPDLSGMAAHHPTEYLVESILNPSAVLVEGPGYIGGDGRSIMPAYPDMTAAQLTHLVAYLKSRGPDAAGHDRGGAREQAAAREQVSGGYRVRLLYRAAGGHAGHAEHQHGAGAAPPRATPPAPSAARDRLMAFIADAVSGQPVPYLPVTARIEAPGKPPRSVTLAPAIGEAGPHYAGDVSLPADTARVTLAIGRASVPLAPGAPAQLARPQSVSFSWK